MSRILLLLDQPPNRRLLAQWLAQRYQVVLAESTETLQEPFDLGILDGPALHRLWEAVQARKKTEEPVFLPVLLLTSRQGVDVTTHHLWRTIDEVVLRPIEKVELQARVEILLRARRLSLDLKRRNDDLQSFMHVMAHDLRAPMRITQGFAQELLADKATTLSDEGRHCLHRILSTTDEAQALMASLLDFARIGRGAVRLRYISLQRVVAGCLRNLHNDIETKQAQIVFKQAEGMLYADPTLLKLALTNLLANGLKFVPPGVPPHLTITASVAPDVCRLHVEDNGIGIAPEHQARIFQPFVRLHGVEEYPGFGLGLATTQRAVELMGGRVGVMSMQGRGSTFWIELRGPEVGREILSC
jgi:signal transduction histidine kinase